MMSFASVLLEHVDSRVEVDEFVWEGEQVVAVGHASGRVKASGQEFRVRAVHVWTLRDGKVGRFEA